MKARFRSSADVKERIRLPYSCSAEDFQRQREARKGPAGTLARDKALAFLKQTWGIDAGDFNLSGIWLPRQLARPDGEAFVTSAVAKMCGVPAGIIELTLDSYVDCAYKRSFTKQAFLCEEAGKAYVEQYQKPGYGTSLDELEDGSGASLLESLRTLTRQALASVEISDISGFYSRILGMNLASAMKGAAQAIGNVMVKSQKRIQEFRLQDQKYCFCDESYSYAEMYDLAEAGLARPSATWNYENVYLLIPGILCPEAALVVTPFELDPVKIQSSAFSAIKKTTVEFGLPPLLVPMIPMSLLDTPDIGKAKSKLGKYPEFANYLLKPESVAQVISPEVDTFIDSSFAVGQSLAQIAARKEIKRVQEKRR
jgi:hypothetical protein